MKETNEVSKLAGVSRRTLQYYDDMGLLHTARSSGNHRLYDEDALTQIWQILLYKEMGFELKEIKNLFTLTDEQKDLQFQKRKEEINRQITLMKIQSEFVSVAQQRKIPATPTKCSGTTYVSNIAQFKKQLHTKITKEEI